MPTNLLCRRRFLTRLTVLPLVAALAPPLAAQVGQRYRIELVIFEHLGAEGRSFAYDMGRALTPDLSGFGLGEGPIRPSQRGFELEAVANRIERSGQGRVLARLAWDQLGRSFDATPWIRVQEGRYLGLRQHGGDEGEAPGAGVGLRPLAPQYERYELEGRIRVWVGRFLHLETDLIYYVPPADDTAPDQPLAVPVRGSQRMNSGEDLFYLDHPVIGIIARVTRLDE